MKKLALLFVVIGLAGNFAGCNSCRRMTGGWFNRGDRCEVYSQPDCSPGVPRATMMLPGTQQVLPGPIEISPIN